MGASGSVASLTDLQAENKLPDDEFERSLHVTQCKQTPDDVNFEHRAESYV